MRKMICVLICLSFCYGCSSPNKANEALRQAQVVSDYNTQAIADKAWLLNRALITETRNKLVTESKLTIALIENPTKDDVFETLDNLNNQLGQEEVERSKDFRFIADSRVANERTAEILGTVEVYLEGTKSMIVRVQEWLVKVYNNR